VLKGGILNNRIPPLLNVAGAVKRKERSGGLVNISSIRRKERREGYFPGKGRSI